MSEPIKRVTFRRLIFTKLPGKLYLWQTGRHCVSSGFNFVCWWYLSVDKRTVRIHLFVQWYRLSTLRILNHCSDHTVSLLFVFVERSVVMCVRVRARPTATSLTTCNSVLCHFVADCYTPVEQGAGDGPRIKGERSNAQTVTLKQNQCRLNL
jgi:hypothetical protein